MTKVPSTYLSHSLDGWVSKFIALISNSLMNGLAIMGLMGIHGISMYLFIILTLEEEIGV